MKNNIFRGADYSVYPGDYTPLFSEQQMKEELNNYISTKDSTQKINIKEFTDSYLATIVVAGASREDFILYTDDTVLSVCMLHNECEIIVGGNFQLHKSICKCFYKKFILPQNADTTFITAEYKAGILELHIPKTNQLPTHTHARVIVY